MRNGLRCFLACVLPCGALDIVRVVHINGHVDEYINQISAGEVLKANPNHVLSKPCSYGGVSHKIVAVSPDSNLKRGNIYFLVPSRISLPKKKMRREVSEKETEPDDAAENTVVTYLMEMSNHRRSVRVGVWKPHLQSISEDDS
ncbi:unknownprotein [Zostera marina]|uniref:DUF4228 domain protein n=1 Tax=Zostera marina TaxID=29655 RepID=A0A0K9PSF1_ZOSMR|nr:unknownprotein [Zostera marina]